MQFQDVANKHEIEDLDLSFVFCHVMEVSEHIAFTQTIFQHFDIHQSTESERLELHKIVLALPEVVEEPPWPGQRGVQHVGLEQSVD